MSPNTPDCGLFAFLRVQVRKQKGKKAFIGSGFFWSERRDSNSRPPVPQAEIFGGHGKTLADKTLAIGRNKV
jgi:hypothetical protein